MRLEIDESEALDFFTKKGWSRDQAAGLVANFKRESNLRATAVGDNGMAYGIAQWHPDRQENFKRLTGKDIRQSSIEEQLDFVHHELTLGNERRAGDRLRGARTAAEAGAIVSQYYERPRDKVGEAAKRAAEANRQAGTALFPASLPPSPIDSLFPGEGGIRRATAETLFPGRTNAALTEAVTTKQSPDKAARIYQMQLRTGLPTSLIEQNLDEIEQQAKRADFDAEKFRRNSPLLATWLAKNPNHAAIAQGDYDTLSGLEKAWQFLQAVPTGFQEGVGTERLGILDYKVVAGTITPQEQMERRQLKSDMQKSASQFTEGWPSWSKSAAQIIGLQLPMGMTAFEKGVKFGLPMGAAAGGALGFVGGPGAPVSVPAGAAIGGMTGFSTVARMSYVEQLYQLSVGEAYGDLEDAKDARGNRIDPVAARYAALLVGVPNAALEFASLRQAVKVVPGADKLLGRLSTGAMKEILQRPSVISALKDFSKRYAGAVGTETFTEGMQKFATIISREMALGGTGEGVTGEDVKAIGAEAEMAFKGSAVLGLLASGPKVVELYTEMDKAEKAEAFMRNLGEVTANSKTYANSPAAYRDFVAHLKETGPVKNVFIPIDSWNSLFQSEAPKAAEELFGSQKAYAEASATGGDLVIPLETYAEKLAGTPYHEQLIPNMRLNPGEMTPAEAAEVSTKEPEILESLQAEIEETQQKEAPLVQVYEDVYGKLRNIGMTNVEANRDALLWRERIRARAERLGVDPLTLYREQPLTVQREIPAGLETYNQQLAEPPVPFAPKLPLPKGEINLPPATAQERKAAAEALAVAQASQEEFGVFGATEHPAKGNMAGTAGVAVAGYPQRGVVTEGAPTQADIETFLRRNRDIFKADKNAALGLWGDNETGKGYLDITNVLPREQAVAQGEYLGELAVWDLEHFEEIRLSTQKVSSQQVLFQGERGASVPASKLIALLKKADPSTFVHESGHLWLEELRQDAMRRDAPEQLVKDWETIKEWTGATDLLIPTNAHEKFARGIEAYIMEGHSPSFQLREVFAQFKDWLVRIYKSMTMLDVELTQEVRDVMDRLLATDEAIKQVHERNTYDIPLLDQSMMTPDEYQAYVELNKEAKYQAEESFRVKVMKELRRERLAEWRKEKEELTQTVREEILEVPIYRAAYWLWSGLLPDGTKIEGMSATKLDKKALLDLGVNPKDLPFRYQENGLHPDIVAELFGFTSGEAMVKELIGLPTLKAAIDEEVSIRMRQEHGDLILDGTFMDQAGMEVQNTRQIDVFNMELRILKRMGSTRSVTHPAILKDLARQIVERKTLGELDPRQFEAAALKAAQEADEALLGREFRMGTGRNLDAAFDAKQRQMLNVFLYREAFERKQAADKAIRKWEKFLFRSDQKLAKYYNMDMVNAARSIAASHGIGSAQETADTFMRALAEYDPQSFEDMQEIVALAASDGRTVDQLTVADFAIVRDAIDGLWSLARRSRQVEVEGRMEERDAVIGQLTGRIGELVSSDKERTGYRRDVTSWDKTKMGLLGAFAMGRRIESWVRAMDGDAPGVFRKYVWNLISEPADQYRAVRTETRKKLMEIVKSVPKDIFNVSEIDAWEIGYKFKDKTTLIGALLHTGNESNLQKLLRGREWGVFSPEGELDSSKWDAFIERAQNENILTKEDYDFIQKIWDLLDELKPEAQKSHKKMYGYFFEEVTARPFDTPFGSYRGGYYPAIVDPFVVEDVAIRQEREAVESRPSSFIFPTTGRGFTRKRTELYARPLSLDLHLIPSHIDKVLRFTYLEPHVKDVGRLITNKEFRTALSMLDSEIGSVALVPWLQRSALQLVEQPSGPRMRQFDKFFHEVRQRTGLQMLSLNVTNALQNVSGYFLARTMVKRKYLMGALWHYVNNPQGYVEQLVEGDAFMTDRLQNQVYDLQKNIDEIVFNPSKFERAKDFAVQHGYFLSTGTQHLMDIITYGGAYEQAIAQGQDEKAARRLAASAVRETQSSFHPEDISRLEAGTPLLRIFTMFSSYFNTAANLNATNYINAVRSMGFGGGARLFYAYVYGFMLPAVVSEMIVQGMSGELFDDDDDDGYLDNVLSVFFGGQRRFLTAMIPVAGPIVNVGFNAFNDRWYDDRISASPAISTIEASVKAPYDIYQLASEENARARQPIKDLLTFMGMVTGLPLAPAARPLGYLADVEQGYTTPEGPVEMTRGLITGRAP